MSEQDARLKNYNFNYQSDIFNQKAPVKEEYNYSHKGFQPNKSNKSSFNFLSWEDNKTSINQPSSKPIQNHIKRNQNIEKQSQKLHQNFEQKLYGNEPKPNIENNRGQKETLFLGNYEGEEYKIKREKNTDYNPNLYYKTKKPSQVKKEQAFGITNARNKPAIQRGKIDDKIVEKNKIKEEKREEESFKNEYIEKKDNFGKRSKFDKNEEKLPMNLDWRDEKTNLLFNGEMNKDIMKKDARQRKFKELYGSGPSIKKERAENNFKINDRKIIEKTAKENNPNLNEAKIKKISENISQIQGNEFLNNSSKYKNKNSNNEDNIKLFEVNSKYIGKKEIERAFAQRGIKIYDVKEESDAIFINKDNKITFKIRENEYDKDFNSKMENIKNELIKEKAEIKEYSQQEKNKGDLIPNSISGTIIT